MKKILISATLLLLTACYSGPQVEKSDRVIGNREYGGEKKPINLKSKIVVGPIKYNSVYAERSIGGAGEDIVQSEFSKSNRFIVLERSDLEAVHQEAYFSKDNAGNAILPNQEFIDAQYIIVPTVTKFAANTSGKSSFGSAKKVHSIEVIVDLQVIDPLSGETWIESGEAKASDSKKTVAGFGSVGTYDTNLEQDAFRVAVIDAMERVIEKVDGRDWHTNVVKVDNNSNMIYLNAGKDSNLKLKSKLNVYEQGEVIKYEGRALGRETKKVGTARVISYLGEDAAIAEYKGDNLALPAIVRFK